MVDAFATIHGSGRPSIFSSPASSSPQKWRCRTRYFLTTLLLLPYVITAAKKCQHRQTSVVRSHSSAFAAVPLAKTTSASGTLVRQQSPHRSNSHSSKISSSSLSSSINNNNDERSYIDKLADAAASYVESTFQPKTSQNSISSSSPVVESQSSFTGGIFDFDTPLSPTILAIQTKTLVRTLVPSIVLAMLSYVVYTPFASFLATLPSYDAQVLEVIGQDYSQYVQNILTTSGLFFSFLVGNTYYFMYTQQEQVFFALFEEVTEAKSLLEQVALVCSGRSMYPQLLEYISDYVQNDLKILTESTNPSSPRALLSKSRRVITGVEDTITAATDGSAVVKEGNNKKKKTDPLEKILYLTSVGVPGVVYETVRSLRTARANRLGALQRKLPEVHMILLKVLAVVVLATFPVCGSGSQAIAPGILEVQAWLFAILVFGISLLLNVVIELWQPTRAGAYSVDGVLSIMIRGLDEELNARMTGELTNCSQCSSAEFPLPPVLDEEDELQLPKLSPIVSSVSQSGTSDDENVGKEEGGAGGSKRKKLRNWVRRGFTRRR